MAQQIRIGLLKPANSVLKSAQKLLLANLMSRCLQAGTDFIVFPHDFLGEKGNNRRHEAIDHRAQSNAHARLGLIKKGGV